LGKTLYNVFDTKIVKLLDKNN